MGCKIRINARVVSRKLQKAARNATRMQAAFREVGRIMAASVRENFRQGGRPDRWARRKSRRGGSHPILIKSGKLRRSVRTKATSRFMDIRSSLPYAATHQHGRGPIVARPFMLIQDSDSKAISKAILAHLMAPFK